MQSGRAQDTIRFRDLRGGNWTWVDNLIIDDYLPVIGDAAFIVYMFLIRNSNNHTCETEQSLAEMSKGLGKSKNTILAAIKTLQDHKLIAVEHTKSPRGNGKNVYVAQTVKPIQKQGGVVPGIELPLVSEIELGVVQFRSQHIQDSDQDLNTSPVRETHQHPETANAVASDANAPLARRANDEDLPDWLRPQNQIHPEQSSSLPEDTTSSRPRKTRKPRAPHPCDAVAQAIARGAYGSDKVTQFTAISANQVCSAVLPEPPDRTEQEYQVLAEKLKRAYAWWSVARSNLSAPRKAESIVGMLADYDKAQVTERQKVWTAVPSEHGGMKMGWGHEDV